MNKESGIKYCRIINRLTSVPFFALGIFVFVLGIKPRFEILPIELTEQLSFKLMSFCLVLFITILVVLPGLVAFRINSGLKSHKKGARTGQIIFSSLMLFVIPVVGTIFHGICIYFMCFSQKSRSLF